MSYSKWCILIINFVYLYEFVAVFSKRRNVVYIIILKNSNISQIREVVVGS
jgi:hypothetical protein